MVLLVVALSATAWSQSEDEGISEAIVSGAVAEAEGEDAYSDEAYVASEGYPTFTVNNLWI